MAKKDEADIRYEDVRREHVDDINRVAHWVYMFGVIIAGFVVMVLLIALLGGGGGGGG